MYRIGVVGGEKGLYSPSTGGGVRTQSCIQVLIQTEEIKLSLLLSHRTGQSLASWRLTVLKLRAVTITFPKKRRIWGPERVNLPQFSSVAQVVSDSLQPYGLQHVRLPCPSLTPRVYSNSCLLSQWCHPTISSSVIPFSSCLQSFPASFSYIGLISFRIDWFDFLAVQGTLKSLLQYHSSKAFILQHSAFFIVQISHKGSFITVFTCVMSCALSPPIHMLIS